MKISAQQARDKKVFIINDKNEVEETTLYDHVVESAEMTTSPRGIEYKLFVIEVEDVIDEESNEHVNKFELRKWRRDGRSDLIESFDTEADAQDEWFDRTYRFDFLPDDQRDTMYFETWEQAEAEAGDRKQ